MHSLRHSLLYVSISYFDAEQWLLVEWKGEDGHSIVSTKQVVGGTCEKGKEVVSVAIIVYLSTDLLSAAVLRYRSTRFPAAINVHLSTDLL